MKFSKGEDTGFKDMNQDDDYEQTPMQIGLSSRFDEDQDLIIIGYPERIATDRATAVGTTHAFADRTFVTITQRTLNWQGIRFHYGHPDLIDTVALRNIGIIEPPLVNEDIEGAYKATLYGKHIDNVETKTGVKQREEEYAGFMAINFKFISGAIQQAMARYISRLNGSKAFGFEKQFMHYVGALGYYLKKVFVPVILIVNTIGILVMGISAYVSFPSVLTFGILSIIFSQSITIPGWIQLIIEKGFVEGTKAFLKKFPKLLVGYGSLILNSFNLKIKDVVIDSNIIDVINSNIEENENSKCYRGLKFKYKSFYGLEDNDYQLLNSFKKISTFKKGEWYRFAIQFQDNLGVWTQPIFIGDLLCTLSPIKQGNEFLVADAVLELHADLKNTIKDKYVNYRLLMAETSHATRSILAQGIVSPTLFNHAERVNNSGPYSIASWIMRPRNGNAQFEHLGGLGNLVFENETSNVYVNINTCEIQNALEALPTTISEKGSELTNNFYVDNSIINFYSPDIKNNENLFKDTDLKFRIVGIIPINNISFDIDLYTNTSGLHPNAGLIKNSAVFTNERYDKSSFTNGSLYLDVLFDKDGKVPPKEFLDSSCKYYIYLWNKKGSLIGQTSETYKEEDDN